jgi:transposase
MRKIDREKKSTKWKWKFGRDKKIDEGEKTGERGNKDETAYIIDEYAPYHHILKKKQGKLGKITMRNISRRLENIINFDEN